MTRRASREWTINVSYLRSFRERRSFLNFVGPLFSKQRPPSQLIFSGRVAYTYRNSQATTDMGACASTRCHFCHTEYTITGTYICTIRYYVNNIIRPRFDGLFYILSFTRRNLCFFFFLRTHLCMNIIRSSA